MRTVPRFILAALAALAFTSAGADDPCGSTGAPGAARSDAAGPCRHEVTQEGSAPHDQTTTPAGSAGAEPAAAQPMGRSGYDGSGDVGPGYYVADQSESQFLLDTWTQGG